MSREIDRMEGAFRKQEQMQPDAEAKAAAISATFEAFEQRKISANSQGSADEVRLKEQGGENPTLSKWRRMMNRINSKWTYSLAGSASVAVLALVLVGPNVSELLPDQSPLELQNEPTPRAGSDVSEKEVTVTKVLTKPDASNALERDRLLDGSRTDSAVSQIQIKEALTLKPADNRHQISQQQKLRKSEILAEVESGSDNVNT